MADLIIIAILAGITAAIVIKMRKNKKAGKSACGCGGCSGCCPGASCGRKQEDTL
ncbi:FeoB-associated Cys-rich membrane protein [Lachnotalea sp. AF33-28]|jgi:hypothetical protein|uniref:FeoB-associated Cys-rich membrane protein n=1 Tax=Lachnotalea sp. AF33-28 TaxID=2292046 RepID=UPI000E496793|nr:FeoB-associated Cys-rich membrane protein [Lachnotalea sp. AF33-28]RHP30993.1 FeoB-associated Cys-rich membrane protein [Lachnotalea sp. AF33-28]